MQAALGYWQVGGTLKRVKNNKTDQGYLYKLWSSELCLLTVVHN